MVTSHFIVIYLLKVGYSIAVKQTISQTPSAVLLEGQDISLECRQTERHERMYWYRQSSGQSLQFLYHFYFENLQEKGTSLPDRFTANRPQTEHCNLNISFVERQDSAVYFCASSLGTALRSKPLFRQ